MVLSLGARNSSGVSLRRCLMLSAEVKSAAFTLPFSWWKAEARHVPCRLPTMCAFQLFTPHMLSSCFDVRFAHFVRSSCGLSAAALAPAGYKCVQGPSTQMWLVYSAGARQSKQNPIAIPTMLILTLSRPGRMPKRQSMS